MWVDSHCHLDHLELDAYAGSLDAAMQAARERGVERFLCVNVELETFNRVKALAEQYPEVYCSVGVHPIYQESMDPTESDLVQRAQYEKVIAIGETGLDYHYCKNDLEWQRERFRIHVRAARQVNKPLIVHTRDARADTIAILTQEKAAEVGGVMHCFTEDWDTAEAALALGFYISFSGIVTFRNAESLREVAARVPLERLLVETDSPWLAPVPHRGKSNEPKYLPDVGKFLAGLRGVEVEEMARITRENFNRLFRL